MLEKPKNNQIGNTLENIKRRLKELEEEYDRVEHSGIDTSKITIEIGDLQEREEKIREGLQELENIKRRLKELEEEYDRVEHSGIDTSKITIEIGDLQELDQKVENRLKELEVNLNIKNN